MSENELLEDHPDCPSYPCKPRLDTGACSVTEPCEPWLYLEEDTDSD
jgi:hypothetical protein